MPEPVSLEEAKAAIGIYSDTSRDAQIEGWIKSARQMVEEQTGLVLVQREVVDWFDGFCRRMELSGWPLPADATVALTYVDADGAEQTIEDHRLIVGRRPAQIAAAYGSVWPVAYSGFGTVSATYTAGVEAFADFPEALFPDKLKQAILLRVSRWFHELPDDEDYERAWWGLIRGSRLVVI